MLRSVLACGRIWPHHVTSTQAATIIGSAFPLRVNDVLVAENNARLCSTHSSQETRFNNTLEITILNESYPLDSCTNVTPRVTGKIGRKLHNTIGHPLYLTRQRIQNYFYSGFVNRVGNPMFAVFDNISPVVTTHQNFDSLLVPSDHPSRSASDTYYINSRFLLRSHTSAHQEELIKMGFNTFLVIGDVYRRDEIDSSHYPAFHQLEGVRLFTEAELFSKVKDPFGLHIHEKTSFKRSHDKQEAHSLDAVKLLEFDLKQTLLRLAQKLFGKSIECRWVNCFFPFTHPSWELEIMFEGHWMEVLGCGIMEQKLLNNAGAGSKIGWAFGLGLDRLTMAQYNIPDIRLLWSMDPRFLNQFAVDNPDTPIKYKPISRYLPRPNDLSFWIPDSFVSSDFYDLVRSVGGDTVEKVSLIDVFTNEKTRRTSHCYTITYAHTERDITQDEVTLMHSQIANIATDQLGVQIR